MGYIKKNSTCFVNNVFHINQSIFNNLFERKVFLFDDVCNELKKIRKCTFFKYQPSAIKSDKCICI